MFANIPHKLMNAMSLNTTDTVIFIITFSAWSELNLEFKVP